jgi:hypothetical protein
MVRNHWDRQKRRKSVDLDMNVLEEQENEGPPHEDPWIAHWRTNLLDLAWSALEEYERSHVGSLSYTVLRLRADFPEATSEELATRLSQQLGREIRPDALRQQLKRARARFAEFLVAEIAAGLDQADPTRIQEELIFLGIYEFIKDVI